MRPIAGLVAALCVVAPAWAQSVPTVAVPPAPALTPAPATPTAPPAPAAPTPPGLGQTPAANGGSALGQSAPGTATGAAPAPATPVPPDAAAVIPNTWLPAGGAILGVLNKVEGSTKKITIPAGGQATVGDLVVSVQTCLTRPPDALPDAAVFLAVQPAGDDSGAAGFRGWMIRSAPGATVVGDAGETFRLIGCS
jgi:hypothetical protein